MTQKAPLISDLFMFSFLNGQSGNSFRENSTKSFLPHSSQHPAAGWLAKFFKSYTKKNYSRLNLKINQALFLFLIRNHFWCIINKLAHILRERYCRMPRWTKNFYFLLYSPLMCYVKQWCTHKSIWWMRRWFTHISW